MDRYRPNYSLYLTIISMFLIISSSIITNHTAEIWLLVSGWIVLFGAIISYVLKIKKEDEE